METIDLQVKDAITLQTKKFGEDPLLKKFEKANAEFKELVNQGLAKPRGYNLLPFEERHMQCVEFNSTNLC